MLRPDTRKLWDYLQSSPLMNGFVLVGGTALTLHLQHRVSEDLDFMFAGHRLPKTQIHLLKRQSDLDGQPFASNDSAAAIESFDESGLSLLDFQQNYVVAGTVKLTLVAPERETRIFLPGDPKAPLRLASLEEVFRLKCLACADRTKTRDWLDMFVMLSRGLFEPYEVFRTFELAGVPSKFDSAMMRMCAGKVPADDEGYEALLPAPPSIEDMRSYFCDLRDRIEVEAARRRMARPPGPA